MSLAVGPWSRTFDGDPVVLPPGPNLPPELPRFAISSIDRQWRVQVSPRRFDVVHDVTLAGEAVSPADFAALAVSVFGPYQQLNEVVRVTRLAYVVRRLAPSANPGVELADFFCKPALRGNKGPLNRPHDFQLHAHKQYRPPNLPDVNSWIRWSTATMVDKDIESRIITIEQDLNTLAEAEPEAAFTAQEVKSFFEGISQEAEQILHLYLEYPEATHG